MFDSADDCEFHEWQQAEQMAMEAFDLYEKGSMSEAMEKLAAAIELSPDHTEWYFNMGLTLDGLEDYARAADFYQRALERNPDDVEILNCLAVDYTRTGRYDLALETFEQIEQIDINFEPAYCNRIITYTEMEMHEKAEQMFYLAQQINPDCPLCFYNIGNSLFTRGLYEKAIWCWDKCAELDPAHPQIHFRLAQACWVTGQAKRAEEEFLTEVRKNPADIDVLLDFGLFQLESGNLENARDKFNRILEFDDTFAPAKFYLGELCRMQGRTEQAHQWYQKTIESDGRLSGPRFRIAEICRANGDYKKAKDLLRMEYRMGLEDIDVLTAMGWMFIQMGAQGDANHCFLQALEQDNQQGIAFFGLGAALAVSGQYDNALQCLKHSIRINNTNRDSLLCAGWLSFKLGKWALALKYAQKCRALSPDQQPYKSRCRELKRAVYTQLAIKKAKTLLQRVCAIIRL
ncbi:MAG: tetratricopeptide repeat protein [Planctomycetaceae bacterium]|nr:tetratricopeptide repeat protein [Planctomycetaceae bacterium]